MRLASPHMKWLQSKTQTISKVGKDVETTTDALNDTGRRRGAVALGKSLSSSYKAKHRTVIWPNDSTPWFIRWKKENTHLHKGLHMDVHSRLHTISKLETIQVCIHQWTSDSQSGIFYHSAIKKKKNGTLTHATAWMNFESTLLHVIWDWSGRETRFMSWRPHPPLAPI